MAMIKLRTKNNINSPYIEYLRLMTNIHGTWLEISGTVDERDGSEIYHKRFEKATDDYGNGLSIRRDATLEEAAAYLIKRKHWTNIVAGEILYSPIEKLRMQQTK